MNCVISGYGKMGSLIEERALQQGYTVTAIVDPQIAGTSKSGIALYKSISAIPLDAVKNAVVIDFTHPKAAVSNITSAAERGLPIVVGTTGWYDKLNEAAKIIEANNSALLYAANFSIGVNLFYKIAAYAAELAGKFDEYDACGLELHHNRKADSPSGTAKILADILIKNMPRKKKAVFDKLDRPPEKDELHFASARAGSMPGTHTVYFDSPADTIEITHTARNREGLVSGAIRAAVWLQARFSEGRRGIFTLEDIFR